MVVQQVFSWITTPQRGPIFQLSPPFCSLFSRFCSLLGGQGPPWSLSSLRLCCCVLWTQRRSLICFLCLVFMIYDFLSIDCLILGNLASLCMHVFGWDSGIQTNGYTFLYNTCPSHNAGKIRWTFSFNWRLNFLKFKGWPKNNGFGTDQNCGLIKGLNREEGSLKFRKSQTF